MAEEILFRIDIEGNEAMLTSLAKIKGELSLVAKEQSDLNAQLKKGTISLDDYAKATAGLDAKTKQLKADKDEMNKTLKQQEQAFKGAEGSMVRISNELNILKDRYRNLSQAERENAEVGGKLLTQIQAKDAEIKKLDATIGDHQRKVGHYGSVWNSLGGQLSSNIPILGGVMNSVQGVTGTMEAMKGATGSNTAAMGLLGGAIGLGAVAIGGLIKVSGDVIASSDALGDKWAEVTTGMKFAYEGFMRALAIGDFSNFLGKMEEAIRVGKEYAQTLDDLENRTRSLNIRESETTIEVDKLRLSLKNVNLTFEERKRISEQIVELEKKIAAEKKTNANIELANEMKVLQMQTGLGEATLKKYLREYTQNSELIQQAQNYIDLQEDLRELQTSGARGEAVQLEMQKMAEAIKNTSSEARIYSTVINSVGKASAEQIQKTVDSWVKANNVTHEYNMQVEKVITTGNKMQKATTEAAGKAAAERQKAADEEEKQFQAMLDNAAKAGAEEGKLYEAAIKEQQAIEARAEKLKLEMGAATQSELLKIAMERVTKTKEFELLTEEQKAVVIAETYKNALKIAAKSQIDSPGGEEWSPDNLPVTGTPTTGSLSFASQGGLSVTDRAIGSMLEGIGVKGTNEQMAQYVDTVKTQTFQLANDIQQMWADSQSQRIQRELKAETAKVDQQTKKELAALDLRRKRGLITENQYNAEKEKIEENAARKKDQLNREAFEKDKKIKLLSAAMAGALAVVQMLANPGGVAGAILAVFAGLTAGLQIAKIAATKYEGARGGMLTGPDHAHGGIKYAYGGNIVELEGGEAVLNKRSMESGDFLTLSGTPRQIASDLNSYNGYGVRFAAGGYTPASTPRQQTATIQRRSLNELADTLQGVKVYVLESDITETQGRVKKIETEASW